MKFINIMIVLISLTFLAGCKWEEASEVSMSNEALVPTPSDGNHPGSGSNKTLADIEGQPANPRQSLESMMSLLDLTSADMTTSERSTLTSEINFRRDLLVSQSKIDLISPSSVIATTSLAGNVCKIAVAKEKRGNKDLFRHLDFSSGLGSSGKTNAINTYLLLVERFWARRPTNEELTLINEEVNAYFEGLAASALTQPVETERLAISICTGMLSLPESYIF